MTFGHESDEPTSHALLDHYVEAGGNLIDTADVYSRGVSEEIIGRWLRARGGPADLIIATKARFATGDGADDVGAGRAHLEKALESSLRRLGLERIDLYQIHAWDPTTPIEETLETLNDFVEAGKIGAIGVSNFLAWQVERAVLVAAREGWAAIVAVQPQYNLLSRDIELELIPVCLDEEIGILPWSPLGGGWLTGKYGRDTLPKGESRLGEDPDRGVEAYPLRNVDRTWRILDTVRSIANDRGATMSQVALNWLRMRPGVSSVLLGCRNVFQLEDNLAAFTWDLSPEEMGKLDLVSAPGIPTYPHGFLEVEAGVDIWERLVTRADRPY
jgi:aryl-alcohol dehydrogenase (NADP+)